MRTVAEIKKLAKTYPTLIELEDIEAALLAADASENSQYSCQFYKDQISFGHVRLYDVPLKVKV